MGEIRNAYESFMGKPEGKTPSVRPWCRWEDTIRMDHREIGLEGVDCILLAQERNH
jgi:hypothetical protein